MNLLKQSTAVTMRIGPCLDSTGAEYTGLVIGDLTLTKEGTSAAMAAAATLTHIANGHYSLVTIAGNTDTLGSWRVDCNKATYQIPAVEATVVRAMIYDSLIAGTDRFDTNVTHINDVAASSVTTISSHLGTTGASTAQTADHTANIAAVKTKTDQFAFGTANRVNAQVYGVENSAITSAALATNCIGSAQLAASASQEIAFEIINNISPLIIGGGYGTTIQGTGNDTTHLNLAESHASDELNGYFLWIHDESTGIKYLRRILDWDLATQLATVETLPFTPEDWTDFYCVLSARELLTGDAFARLGAPAGASVSADVAAMAARLPARITKNTALAAFPFKMVLDSDGKTPATGLTVTATRSLDGGAFAACANVPVEISGGAYTIDLANTDLNGNTIMLRLAGTLARTIEIAIFTQPS